MDDFLLWAQDRGIKSPYICPKKTENAGYGLFTVTDTPCTDVLLHIPRAMIITASRTLQQPDFLATIEPMFQATGFSMLKKPLEQDVARICICLFLIYNQKKCESPWKPYLNILPTFSYYKHSHVLFNPDILAGTSLENAVLAKRASLKRELERLIGCSSSGWVKEIDLDLWMWSNATFWSRVVNLESNDEKVQNHAELALVPFFDIANHTLKPTVRWQLEKDGLNVVKFGSVVLREGDELTLFYGEKSNQELLFLHGFCLHDNPTGSCITLPVVPFLADNAIKREWLNQHVTKPALTLTAAQGNPIVFPPGHKVFEQTGWSVESIAMMYLVVLDEDDGLHFKKQQSLAESPDAFVKDVYLSTLDDILQSVHCLAYSEVIQLRVVVTLLDAVHYHLEQLAGSSPTGQSGFSSLHAYVEHYKAEEKNIFEKTFAELSRLRDELVDNDVVQGYLQSIQQV